MAISKKETMSEILANYVSNLRISDLPDEIIERGQISIIDAMGCAFAGHRLQSSQIALSIFKKLSTAGDATLWLNGQKGDLLNTSWANCLLVHSALQDDMQASTVGHMGSMIIPTALALAEIEKKTGAELISAIVAAYEVAGRIASQSGKKIVSRGFRGSPVFGTFASAAAAGKLLGLDKKELKTAIDCAASFSCGILEPINRGAMEWRFQNGSALQGGIMAALLASQGLDTAGTALEGEFGFFAAFGGKELSDEINGNMTRILASLGKDYEISQNNFKPYTTGGKNQVGVELVINLVKKNDIRPNDIEMVRVKVPSDNKAYPGITNQGPFTSFERALVSKPFAIASAVKFRDLIIDTYLEHMEESDILDLAKRVNIEAVEGMGHMECEVELIMKDGRKYYSDANSMDILNFRLDRGRAIKKFEKMSSSVLSKERASKIGAYIFQLAELPDLSELPALLLK